MGLTIVGGALLITGLLMVAIGEAQRLKSSHREPEILRMGEFLAVCGLGIGILLLVAMTVGQADRGPASDQADRSRADRSRASRNRADASRTDASRADRSRAGRLQAGPGGRGKGRRRAAASTGPRQDPAGGWLSRPQGRADGWPQDLAGGWSGPPQEPVEEWLGPLRTAGVGLVPQRAQPAWLEPAEQHRPGSGEYADDGWHPDLDGGWDPGPAHVWNSRGEDGWTGGDQDGRPGGEDWNPAASWPSADPGAPSGTDQEAGPTGGSQPGHRDAPAPGQLTGPQPAYLVGAEPEGGRSPDVWQGSLQEKLDQIKDLYLTAEAIGEDALGKHFDQLSQRQRALIREFFEQAGVRSAGAAAPPGGESAENGAPLPG